MNLLRSIALAAVMTLAFAGTARADEPHVRPFEISLIPPVNVWHVKPKIIVGVSVNLLYGRSQAVAGVEVGVVNREDGGVGLLQVGAINVAGGGCYGVCAGAFGQYHGNLGGLQLSPFFNGARDVRAGIQVGFWNFIRRDAGFAVQIGGLNGNNRLVFGTTRIIDHGRQRGIQLGVGNAAEDYRGLQVGLFNADYLQLRGVAISVFINFVGGPMRGGQVGFANYADEVHGVQIGVINVTHRLHGVQIGAINVATKSKLPFTVLLNVGF